MGRFEVEAVSPIPNNSRWIPGRTILNDQAGDDDGRISKSIRYVFGPGSISSNYSIGRNLYEWAKPMAEIRGGCFGAYKTGPDDEIGPEN